MVDMWNNIKTDLREIAWCGVNSIDVTLDRDQWMALVSKIMNIGA
jgi:hypothetical protein